VVHVPEDQPAAHHATVPHVVPRIVGGRD
jgi:hypothetical protein